MSNLYLTLTQKVNLCIKYFYSVLKQEQSLQPIEAESGLTSTPIQAFKT